MATTLSTSLQVLPSGYVVNHFIGSIQMSGRIDYTTIKENLSGNQEVGTYDFEVTDYALQANVANAIKDEAFVEVSDAEGTRFKGFLRQRRPLVAGAGRTIPCTAYGIESLLDTIQILANTRSAGESDADRIKYFLATYGSQGLYNDSFGSTDVSKIRTLNASMPKQKFKYMSLRKVIESILGVASETSDYYVDALGRLHTFDVGNPEGDNAPYVVRVGTPSAGEIAPEELDIEFDSQTLRNDYFVRAKYRSADVRVADQASIDLYGRRADIVDAPDADTSTKATAVGNAALKDNAAPKVRGGFKVSYPYTAGWKVGQMITFYSNAVHGLNGAQSRIVGIMGGYLSADGQRQLEIRFGGDRLRLRGGGTLDTTSGAVVSGSMG